MKYTASLVQCSICTHQWVAVRPLMTLELECPNCLNTTFVEIIDD
jgi:hypothetical protein